MTIVEARMSVTQRQTEDIANNKADDSQLQEEFSEIVERYSNFVYNVALRMTRNPTEAEDVAQEAFLSAYKAYSSFRGQAQVSTWLYRITVNSCLMRIRKAKTRQKYLTETGYDDVVVKDWTNDPEKAAINSELREALQEGLSRLSPEFRAAVVLRDVQGLSSQEAAEALNISVPALKTRLHRGRVLGGTLKKSVNSQAV